MTRKRVHRPASLPKFYGGGLPVQSAPEPDPDEFVNPFNDRIVLAFYRDVQAWHGYIRFLGLPHLRDNPDIPIDTLFVAPDLSSQAISPDQPPERWPERSGALESVTAHPRLVVLGDPGSGKSTLVSWIAWQLSLGRTNPWTRALGPLLPLPMVVRDLRLRDSIRFDELLEEFLRQPVAEALDRSTVERYLQNGQCLLLLDGLDEVGAEAVRQGLWLAVREGVERYPSCRWLLTSRKVGYDRVPFHVLDLDGTSRRSRSRDAGNPDVSLRAGLVLVGEEAGGPRGAVRPWAEVLYVAPFHDPQIKTFAANWYARTTEVPSAAETKAQDLLSALHSNPATLSLARVPNLLTLIALIHRIQARLPNGRAVLYDKIVEAYLESIDAYRGIQETDYTLEEKKRWLAWVGFQMQRRRGNGEAADGRKERREVLVDEEELLAWLGEAMARSPRVQDVADPGQAARAFIDYIARRSGLLLPRGHGQYAFTHLSFQEFFAALHLLECITSPRWFDRKSAEGGGPADLKRYADDDIWREPLVLLFGLLAGRPEWAEELAILLFGEEFKELEQDRTSRLAIRALLLAEVSTDPHSGLPGDLRSHAWDVCWHWELSLQARKAVSWLPGGPSVAAILADADQSDQAGVWRSFQRVAATNHVTHVNLSDTHVADLSSLAELTSLQELYLFHTQVVDLSPLAGLANLQSLFLSGTQVADLSPLAGLANLQFLFLAHTSVADLSPLAQLANLGSLALSGTQVADLSPIAELAYLWSLELSGTRVADLSPLAELVNLHSLNLSGTQVADLSPLAELAKLRSLNLSGTQVTDLSPIAELANLKSLRLSDTQVVDLSPLAELASLQSLELSGTQVVDLSPLAELANLHLLDLSRTQVADLSPLADLKINELDLAGTQVADLSPLAELASLESLDLSRTQVADLSPVGEIADLQALYLTRTQVADLSPLAELAGLQALYLAGTRVADLSPLAELLYLEELDLSGTRVTDLSPLAKLMRLQVFGGPSSAHSDRSAAKEAGADS
jgi:internalin A